MSERRWTEQDVRKMLSNPIYTGMGPFPAAIEEDLWVSSNELRIIREGAAEALALIVDNFEEVFPHLPRPEVEQYVQDAEAFPESTLRRLLVDLRERCRGVTAAELDRVQGMVVLKQHQRRRER